MRIALDPTDQRITVRPAELAQDAEASLRSELSTHIANAEADLRAQIASLSGASDSTALAQTMAQLGGLTGLERQIAHAGGKDLASIRNEVSAYVAATQTFLQQTSQAGAKETGAQALNAASAAARQSVADFTKAYYEQRIFDPYLKFASVEDEEAYRRKETERQHAIEKALAEKTPEGDLRASKLATEQLKDAGAHGADQSPAFQTMLDSMNQSTANLEKQINGSKVAQARTMHANELDEVPAKAASSDILAGLKSLTFSDSETTGHGVPERAAKQSPGRAT